MTKPVDVVVPRAVFLDVEVGLRDVRFWLVVVVVRDEVLDRVRREELAELVAELRGKRLVVGDHERRLLNLLDDPGHRRRLAGSRRAEERLVPLTRAQAGRQRFDRRRLVTGGRVRRRCFQRRHDRDRVLGMTTQTTRPYTAYAAIMSTFVGSLAAAGALAKLFGRD